MSVRRMRAALALLVTAVLALTACAGLPSSGPVQQGLGPDSSSGTPDFSFLPDRPQPGASPEEIVEGFIRAGSGPGALGRWERAREFLAPDFAEVWRPEAGVTVDTPGDRVYSEGDDGDVTVSVVAVATVDDKGSYQRAEAGPTDLPFALEQQDDGEWRITSAPDGVVLDRDIFPNVFHEYAVVYFDPSWQYLVPDVRWFPTANAATRIADALVNRSRSVWLEESVSTAFPETVTLLASVPVSDSGVAEIDLSATALDADSVTLDRMLTQLTASLATAGASSVELTVASSPIDAQTVTTRSTRVASLPLVLTDDGFGFLNGDALEEIPGLSESVMDAAPSAIQVSPDRRYAAVTVPGGAAARVGADGTLAVVDERPGVVAPTMDPFGVVWTVPEDAPGAVRASQLDGTTVQLEGAWAEATAISAMAISRDGTRMAAIVSAAGRDALWVAGVVRSTDGVPIRLGEPIAIGLVPGSGTAIAWLDESTVAALSAGEEASTVLEQVIGGPSSVTAAAQGMRSLAGGATVSVIRVHDGDAVYAKRGTNWEQIATGVTVLATQQGIPQ
ncbi:GerMN domain-containing protein [Microbacterium sp. C7(2022)]|uniref:GerMN domain-containing protein n=1 Tax=Microbacterium sp. C7(2022) TaxID=2992759 RepID=UPI00237B2BED|nr:GerMN domain-containing protein [Microbacterium sp. C7(2022)]MDE0547298.1 LpqB family beta-propeller domain-containing protein [Microbacterium sp. C7(2022)]